MYDRNSEAFLRNLMNEIHYSISVQLVCVIVSLTPTTSNCRIWVSEVDGTSHSNDSQALKYISAGGITSESVHLNDPCVRVSQITLRTSQYTEDSQRRSYMINSSLELWQSPFFFYYPF